MSIPAPSVSAHNIDWPVAQAAVGAAAAAAQSMRLRVNIAVVDSGGNLMAFVRMPGAFLHSIDISIDKAFTAASFGFPTSQWKDIMAGDENLRLGLALRPRLVIIGGGLPILQDGERIGGIGVSGGSAEQDEVVARAGLEAIGLA
jgi:uncharacterized protein GlcG (DUF336 family)